MPMRVLIVEDAPRRRQLVINALTSAGFEPVVVTRYTKALAALNDAAQEFAAVVVEESIKGGKGLQLVREARVKRGHVPVVVVTRDGNWRSYAEALGLGAIAYLPFPINTARLISALGEAVKPPCRKRQNDKQIHRRNRR
jgi:DNA-binding NtrC family response regulator